MSLDLCRAARAMSGTPLWLHARMVDRVLQKPEELGRWQRFSAVGVVQPLAAPLAMSAGGVAQPPAVPQPPAAPQPMDDDDDSDDSIEGP